MPDNHRCDVSGSDATTGHPRDAPLDEVKKTLGRRIQHLWTIVAPVPYCWVSWRHLHASGIVVVKEIERKPRIASVVADTEPAIIVSGVQD